MNQWWVAPVQGPAGRVPQQQQLFTQTSQQHNIHARVLYYSSYLVLYGVHGTSFLLPVPHQSPPSRWSMSSVIHKELVHLYTYSSSLGMGDAMGNTAHTERAGRIFFRAGFPQNRAEGHTR